MKKGILAPCILSLILAPACASDSPTIATTAFAPSAAFANAPGTAGPVIFRTTQDQLIFLVPDPAAGLTATLGLYETYASWCDPTALVTIAPLEAQILFKPTGVLGEHLTGEVPVIIYDVGTFDFCPDLVDATIVAMGTARLTSLDHKLTQPFEEDLPSYGYRATGTVTYTTGGTAQFSGVVKWVTTGTGEVRVNSHIILSALR